MKVVNQKREDKQFLKTWVSLLVASKFVRNSHRRFSVRKEIMINTFKRYLMAKRI